MLLITLSQEENSLLISMQFIMCILIIQPPFLPFDDCVPNMYLAVSTLMTSGVTDGSLLLK
jgi:hypothetical protein